MTARRTTIHDLPSELLTDIARKKFEAESCGFEIHCGRFEGDQQRFSTLIFERSPLSRAVTVTYYTQQRATNGDEETEESFRVAANVDAVLGVLPMLYKTFVCKRDSKVILVPGLLGVPDTDVDAPADPDHDEIALLRDGVEYHVSLFYNYDGGHGCFMPLVHTSACKAALCHNHNDSVWYTLILDPASHGEIENCVKLMIANSLV